MVRSLIFRKRKIIFYRKFKISSFLVLSLLLSPITFVTMMQGCAKNDIPKCLRIENY